MILLLITSYFQSEMIRNIKTSCTVFFFNTYCIYLQVNHNGFLTFDTALGTFTPQRFPLHGPRDFISAFWTDLDNRNNGQIYYNQYTSGTVLQRATRDINSYFPGLSFSATWVFVATWYQVAYYPTSGTVSFFLLDAERLLLYINYCH